MSFRCRDDINAREKEPRGVLARLIGTYEILHGRAHGALEDCPAVYDTIEAQEHAKPVTCRCVALGHSMRFRGANDVREACLRHVIAGLREGVRPVVEVQGAPESRRKCVCFPSATDPHDGAPRKFADELGDDVRVEGVELLSARGAGMVFH